MTGTDSIITRGRIRNHPITTWICVIEIEGENKWLTVIQMQAKSLRFQSRLSNLLVSFEWSMILSGWKGANERQTTIISWFIGISAILLVLYLTAPKPNADKRWFDYLFQAFAVILLIVSISLYIFVSNISPNRSIRI